MISDHELRQILLEDAEDAPTVQANELMSGIRHKVQVRRRARLAGAAAAVAVVVAASLAIVPSFVDSSSPEPIKPPDRPHLEFPAQQFPEDLVAFQVNQPGTSSFEWETKLSRRSLVPYLLCRVPQQYGVSPEPGVSSVVVGFAINGEALITGDCAALDRFGRPRYPPLQDELDRVLVGRIRWDRLGVDLRDPFVVSMWLQRDGQKVEVPRAEFGVGFYWYDESKFIGG